MKFESALAEALPNAGDAGVAMASKHSGTDDATKVDWSSGGGPETNIGKRYQRTKKKKKKYPPKWKENKRGFGEVYSTKPVS